MPLFKNSQIIKQYQTLIMSIQFKSASLCTNTRKTSRYFSAKLNLIHCETFLASEMKEMVQRQQVAVLWHYLSKEGGSAEEYVWELLTNIHKEAGLMKNYT